MSVVGCPELFQTISVNNIVGNQSLLMLPHQPSASALFEVPFRIFPLEAYTHVLLTSGWYRTQKPSLHIWWMEILSIVWSSLIAFLNISGIRKKSWVLQISIESWMWLSTGKFSAATWFCVMVFISYILQTELTGSHHAHSRWKYMVCYMMCYDNFQSDLTTVLTKVLS